MGEVKLKIRLTTAIDEGLVRRKQLDPAKVRACDVTAMVDTGAVMSVIPPEVMQQLGVEITGNRVAEYADGRKDRVDVTEPVVFNVLGRRTPEETLVLGDEVLIGQTVLEKLDLQVDCANQQLIPNPAHPDQAVTKVK
jgi:clan AA aspartic protease